MKETHLRVWREPDATRRHGQVSTRGCRPLAAGTVLARQVPPWSPAEYVHIGRFGLPCVTLDCLTAHQGVDTGGSMATQVHLHAL